MHYSHILHHLQRCLKQRRPLEGQRFHAYILKTCLNYTSSHLCNILVELYSKCGLLQDAQKLFDEIPNRDLFSWASILTAHNQAGFPGRTLSLLCTMSSRDLLEPDHFVLASIVKACAGLNNVRLGKQVHAQFLLSPFWDDEVVKSSLVDMYAKCGLPNIARAVFDTIRTKNLVSCTALISGYARSGLKCEATGLLKELTEKSLLTWTALISGLVQSGHLVDAFGLFIEMRREAIDIIDPFVLSTMSSAAANISTLELGKQVHCLVLALGYDSNLYVSNGLVDMYAKCSDVSSAKNIFDDMDYKDVVSWTSIIVGMAQHGQAGEAISLYDEMILAHVKPNEVTFTGLLYACSHAGLVDKGRKVFKSMVECYGLSPSLQHYTCLLDLYGRSGHLDEAEDLLKTMPFDPDDAAWAALLSACNQHRNTKMGVRIADSIMRLGPESHSTCILVSNAYAAAGMWENVAEVRKLMEEMETRKEPGYSCMNMGKETVVFYAGDSLHPMRDEILAILKETEAEMRRRGYVPDTSLVLHDMGQQEKERQLFWHSERLAVAYGLLKSFPGAVIRITKNLRVCGDCHNFLKLISSIRDREIVVRDSSRFHHFKDGMCSCHDFW